MSNNLETIIQFFPGFAFTKTTDQLGATFFFRVGIVCGRQGLREECFVFEK